MTFEFTIEVRPEFDMPQVEGPEAQAAGARVHRRRRRRAAGADAGALRPARAVRRRGLGGRLCLGEHHVDGRRQAGRPRSGSGRADSPDAELPRRPARRLRQTDEGRRRPATSGRPRSTLTQDAPNAELRGKKVDVEFEVLDVKKLKLPELTEEFLQEIGGFESEDRAPRRDSQEPRAAAGVPAAARSRGARSRRC